MQALMLDATWEPRAGFKTVCSKCDCRSAPNASTAWRHPKFQLIDRPIPQIKSDEVLVKVKSCGICGSDLHCCTTDQNGYVLFSGPARLPVILGHEFAGEIVEAGSDVRNLKVGQAVAVESINWCGKCDSCRAGNLNQCQRVELVGLTTSGALAEYIAINERFCWSLESLRDSQHGEHIYESGAFIEPIGCAYNGMFVAGGGFSPGAFVAVYGVGPIGLGAVMLARAAGAAKVIAFDISEPRNMLALAFGADFAANPQALARDGISTSDFVKQVTGGRGADVQIEAAGAAAETVPQILKGIAANGKMIYLGRAGDSATVDLNSMVTQANQIIGSRGHAGHGVFANVIRLLASGRINPHPMVTARFGLPDVAQAIEQSATRHHGKVMVNVNV